MRANLAIDKETKRIRSVYASRNINSKLYLFNKQDVMFMTFRMRFQSVALFNKHDGWTALNGKDILDVGCGTGKWLRFLMECGSDIERLHGIDMLSDRIEHAKKLSPNIDLRVCEGWPVPYNDNSMDLVSAHTVFSSILDPNARKALANEMTRVVRPKGLIMVF